MVQISLPQTKLNYISFGRGDPLIIVPATISEINSWLPLVKFMGQEFKAYFFELPGHGQSSALTRPFSGELLAEMIETWLSQLKIHRFNLMGFSFGGILAAKTLLRLEPRIDRLILLAPCLSHRAVKLSRLNRALIKLTDKLLTFDSIEDKFFRLIHDQERVELAVRLLAKLGHVEIDGSRKAGLKQKLLQLPRQTLAVLQAEVGEILSFEFPQKTFSQPCFFGMSVNDPLLDYQTTETVLKQSFANLFIKKFSWHYHQPPRTPEFEFLVRRYQPFLKLIKNGG